MPTECEEAKIPDLMGSDTFYMEERIRYYQRRIAQLRNERITEHTQRIEAERIADLAIRQLNIRDRYTNEFLTPRDRQEGWQIYIEWVRENNPDELQRTLEIYQEGEDSKGLLYKLIEKIIIFFENIFNQRREYEH